MKTILWGAVLLLTPAALSLVWVAGEWVSRKLHRTAVTP